MFLEGLGDFITGLFGSSGGGSAVADASSGLLPEAGGGVADVAGGATQLAGPGFDAAAGVAPGAATGGGLDFAGLFGGAKDFLGGAGSFAKGALPFAQLGLGGLGIASNVKAQQQAAQAAKLQREGLKVQERAATPLTNFGESQLRAAQGGNVPTAVQAQIDLWKQGAKAKVRDYLARAGIADSSTAVQWDAMIDQQAEAMKAAALADEQRLGTGALSQAAGAGANLAQTAGQQASSFDNLIASANQMLARLGGAAA